MNVTLVKNAEDNVDRDDRGKNEERFVCQRSFEGTRGSLELRLHAQGHTDLLLGTLNGRGRMTQGRARRQIK